VINLDPYVGSNLYWVLPILLLVARLLMGFLFAWGRGDAVDTWRFASEQAAELPASLTVIAFAIAAAPSLRLLATGQAQFPLTLISTLGAYALMLLFVAFFVFMGRRNDLFLLPAYLLAGLGTYLAVNAFPS
jgi:hypothetical protein